MEPILVTGSAGHIGRHVCAALRGAGFRVRGLDLLAREPERGDIRDRIAVLRAVDGVAGIIHLAAVSRVADAEADPTNCVATNVGGTRILLEAATHSARCPWFLFASSREVLGSIREGTVADEATSPAPCNHYGHSKAESERQVSAAASSGLTTCSLRLSNIFGSAWDREERAIPSFVRSAIAAAPLRVRGPTREFDFLHVDDALRALLAVVAKLTDASAVPPVLQLCTGRSVALADAARVVLAATSSRSPLLLDSAAVHEVDRFCGSRALAARTLGWRPRVSFETGIARLVTQRRVYVDPEVTC